MKIRKSSTGKRTRHRLKRDVSHQRPININDRDSVLEAMTELRAEARVRMHFNLMDEETWAMLMGAKALDRLAG